MKPTTTTRQRLRAGVGGVAVWSCAWALIGLAMGGQLELAVGALLLVMATAVSASMWNLASTLAASFASLLAFNWLLVPPRGSLRVALHEHLALLVVLMLCVVLVAGIAARQRHLAQTALRESAHSDQLRALVDALREADDPLQTLAAALAEAVGTGATVVAVGAVGADNQLQGWHGEANAHVRDGLAQCVALGAAFGPGTGRHEGEDHWWLPLRGHTRCQGAVCLPVGPVAELPHLQALCDQAGLCLERLQAQQLQQAAQRAAADQRLRNTLLAAIAHDHRTPLAGIITAASSLCEQGQRLDLPQRNRLAANIQAEAELLLRMTENSLQLARLEGPHAALSLSTDWESPEELVGSVLQRWRQRDSGARIKAYVEPGLPLLRCDAVLVVQALENLLENALRHGGETGVALRAERRTAPDRLVLSVLDRGPGLPPDSRAKLFEPFQRGANARGRGAGLGLALCLAVAQTHGGDLRALPREGGGTRFDLELPLQPPPDEPPTPAA